jgi:DNA-binding response OmpR family regulator
MPFGSGTWPQRKPDGLLAGQRVLILEDEALIALDLEMFAEHEGAYSVTLAGSVSEAEAMAKEEIFDLGIIDVMLPDGTSVGLARSLARKGATLVFYSGHADPGDLARQLPEAGFCAKPCPHQHLKQVVAERLAA